MDIHFEAITDKNRKKVLKLHTASGQEGYVESVAECLREAKTRSCWRPVAIYDGGRLVGFAMYGFFPEYLPFGRVWMDRFLIDQAYQGHGYGSAAMRGLLRRITREYHRRTIYLSVVEGNVAAFRLYEKFGFKRNGERDVHGEAVMVCRSGRPMRERLISAFWPGAWRR